MYYKFCIIIFIIISKNSIYGIWTTTDLFLKFYDLNLLTPKFGKLNLFIIILFIDYLLNKKIKLKKLLELKRLNNEMRFFDKNYTGKIL